MGLDAIRDKARAAVHSQFALPATVTSPEGTTQLQVTARLHLQSRKPFGDLDREGFAMVMESHNEVIFDTEEWDPVRNWVIDFGRGRVYVVADRQASQGDRYVKVWVTEADDQ